MQWEVQKTSRPRNIRRKWLINDRIYNNPGYLLHFKEPTEFKFYLQPIPTIPKPGSNNRFAFRKNDIPACGIVVARIVNPGSEYEIVYSSEIEEYKAYGFTTL